MLTMPCPKRLGYLVDPCDHHFHGVVHPKIDRELSILNAKGKGVTVSKMVSIINDVYKSISAETVQSYFIGCGSTGNSNPEKVADKLLSEGQNIGSKYLDLHKRQLRAFLKDCVHRGKDFPLVEDESFVDDVDGKEGPLWSIYRHYRKLWNQRPRHLNKEKKKIDFEKNIKKKSGRDKIGRHPISHDHRQRIKNDRERKFVRDGHNFFPNVHSSHSGKVNKGRILRDLKYDHDSQHRHE